MISISQFTDISNFSRTGRPKNFGKIYLDKQILPSIFQIIRNTKLSAQNRFFICQTNLFVKTFFSVALFCKITNLEENSLNKRSKIGAEISLVSRTQNHFFITMDLIDMIKTTPPNNTASKGAISDTVKILPAVQIRTK